MKWTCVVLILIWNISLFQAQGPYFPPNFSQDWETVDPASYNWCADELDNLDAFLAETNTKAFILLKEGKIVHESYFDDFDLTSLWYWASAGKSLTAVMVGLLQEEGLLHIDDASAQFLGNGWTSCEASEEESITIRNQLTMTTGLDYTGSGANCLEAECFHCLNAPGEEWYYHNSPYILLSDVLEAASDQGYTGLTNNRLANKIGFVGLWSDIPGGKLFFSTARGMARFGLLMLRDGFWNEEEIIKDKTYYDEMLSSSQEINPAYGYLWWLNGKDHYRLPGSTFTFQGKLIPDAPDDLYAAIGKNGQILMVVPSQDLIIVRMGDNPDESLVPASYVRELWDAFSMVDCVVDTKEVEAEKVDLYPNPMANSLTVQIDENVKTINIYTAQGDLILRSTSRNIDVGDWPQGLYFVEIVTEAQHIVRKVIKG